MHFSHFIINNLLIFWVSFQTAEALHVKGFADKADREFLAAALLLNEDQPSSPFSENQLESDDAESCSNNKRPRNESNEDHSKSNHEQLLSPELKRKFFQTSGDDTISSCRLFKCCGLKFLLLTHCISGHHPVLKILL